MDFRKLPFTRLQGMQIASTVTGVLHFSLAADILFICASYTVPPCSNAVETIQEGSAREICYLWTFPY